MEEVVEGEEGEEEEEEEEGGGEEEEEEEEVVEAEEIIDRYSNLARRVAVVYDKSDVYENYRYSYTP